MSECVLDRVSLVLINTVTKILSSTLFHFKISGEVVSIVTADGCALEHSFTTWFIYDMAYLRLKRTLLCEVVTVHCEIVLTVHRIIHTWWAPVCNSNSKYCKE